MGLDCWYCLGGAITGLVVFIFERKRYRQTVQRVIDSRGLDSRSAAEIKDSVDECKPIAYFNVAMAVVGWWAMLIVIAIYVSVWLSERAEAANIQGVA